MYIAKYAGDREEMERQQGIRRPAAKRAQSKMQTNVQRLLPTKRVWATSSISRHYRDHYGQMRANAITLFLAESLRRRCVRCMLVPSPCVQTTLCEKTKRK